MNRYDLGHLTYVGTYITSSKYVTCSITLALGCLIDCKQPISQEHIKVIDETCCSLLLPCSCLNG